MNAKWLKAKARVSHRLAMPLRVGHIDRDAAERIFGEAQNNNKRLIFHHHDDAGEPRPYAQSPARMEHVLEAAAHRPNSGPGHGGSVVMRRRLNAFFAISVNSPSMSMVNFSCCVCSAPITGARGVTRRVTPQPMRAAVRMEAGAHACL
jgi:hypothetical protein